MGCGKEISNTCGGKRLNARCVDYEGTLHKNSNLSDCDCYDVEDVIEDINSELDDINNQIDLSGLGSDCITYSKDGEGRIAVKEALLKIEALVCELKQKVDAVDEADCLSIFTQDFTCLGLDFKCLTDPCGDQITNMKELFQALIDNACP